jgi:hypothetical protein
VYFHQVVFSGVARTKLSGSAMPHGALMWLRFIVLFAGGDFKAEDGPELRQYSNRALVVA